MTQSAPAKSASERAAEMLAEAAEMDLALARRVHARAMAAEDDAALAELTRAQNRALRSMRQSLALAARLGEIRARADLVRGQAERARGETAQAERPRKDDYPGLRRRGRELAQAAGRVILRYTECEEEREALFEFLDDVILGLDPRGDFSPETLDAQVHAFCDEMDIPAALYTRWRELPPVAFEDEAGNGPDAPEPAPAAADSG
ncbi:MAG: hypothetical protein ACOY5Y_15810 [Pseudomonadota bacterium]